MTRKLIYLRRGIIDEGMMKFQLNIHSDIENLAHQIGQNGAFITTRHIPHILLGAALIKCFLFTLDTEAGESVAACYAFFVNSELAQRRMVTSYDELPSTMNPYVTKVVFDARTIDWLESGTNFVCVPFIHALQENKDDGSVAWLARNVPYILSDVYGLSFQKIAVSFHIRITNDDFEQHPELLDDELGERRLINQKRMWLREIMSTLGYEEMKDIADVNRAVFCRNN